MKVLIVGGGIGGLALASFFEKSNIDYLLVERDKDWSRHGFSLGMWSNGRHILSELGVADKFDETMRSYHKLIVKTFSSKFLKVFNLREFVINYGLGYSHIFRKDLHSWLLKNLPSEKIKMQTVVKHIQKITEGMEVVFENGSRELFDLVVGADGIHSGIRNTYFPDQIEKYVNWRIWYVIPKKKISSPNEVVEYIDTGRFFNVFDEKDGSLVIMGASVEHQIYDQEEGRVKRLREIFKGLSVLDKTLEDMSDREIMPTDFAEVFVKKWYKDEVVLVGDAAHAFEPFAGLGGSMALEDAYVLFKELIKVDMNYSLKNALETYEQKRKIRVQEAFNVTKKMQFWATIRSKSFFKLLCLFAPLVPVSYFSKDFVKLMNKKI